jgi:pentapeptide MXKDX repeat protein
MKKLSTTIFAVCLAASSAGAWAQADTTKKGSTTTDGMAKDSMNKGAVEKKDAQNKMDAGKSSPNTVRNEPTKGSSNTTDGMAKDSMNKGAVEKKDAQTKMDAGKSQSTPAREDQKGTMNQDPMKKDKDGMKK